MSFLLILAHNNINLRYHEKNLTIALALLTLICTSTHAQLPSYLPADGLVGWWPFNGNANDESGNGNNGTVLNGTTLTSDRNDIANSAYEIDGVNCSSLRGVSFPAILQNTEYSISLWCKSNDSTKTNQTIINSFPHNFFALNLNYPLANSLNKFRAFFGNDGWILNADAMNWNSIQKQNWKHFMIIKTLSELKFYENGRLVFTQILSPIANPGQMNAFTCGAITIQSSGSVCYETFKGKIDDVAIYNRALTEQQIQALYTQTPIDNNVITSATQVPAFINYQALARSANGAALANADLQVRFTLLADSLGGATEYSETHALTTNALGLFTTAFGSGTPEVSTFESIAWDNSNKFLRVELNAGNGCIDMGKQQLLSVPFALRSQSAAAIRNENLPVFNDNANAVAAGLAPGTMYRTSSGVLMVVYWFF